MDGCHVLDVAELIVVSSLYGVPSSGTGGFRWLQVGSSWLPCLSGTLKASCNPASSQQKQNPRQNSVVGRVEPPLSSTPAPLADTFPPLISPQNTKRPSFVFLVTASGVVVAHSIRRWQMQPVYSFPNETIVALSSSKAESLLLSELQNFHREKQTPPTSVRTPSQEMPTAGLTLSLSLKRISHTTIYPGPSQESRHKIRL